MNKLFMNVKELAEYISISEKKIYSLVHEQKIPATKATGKWLFAKELIDQWLIKTSHGGVMSDRLIITGDYDLLLQKITEILNNDLQDMAFVNYSPTNDELGIKLLTKYKADVSFLHWGSAEQSEKKHSAFINSINQTRKLILVRLYYREQGLAMSPNIKHTKEEIFTQNLKWSMPHRTSGNYHFFQKQIIKKNIMPEQLNITKYLSNPLDVISCLIKNKVEVAPLPKVYADLFNLPFISLGQEACDLVLSRNVFFRKLFQRILEVIESDEIQQYIEHNEGYIIKDCGKIIWSS